LDVSLTSLGFPKELKSLDVKIANENLVIFKAVIIIKVKYKALITFFGF
jgi:hypothetical protein